jgi:hypothetical protein
MSTSDMPVPHQATIDEAMAALSDDPAAYNLPPGTSDEEVQKRKQAAAADLVAGSAANAAYWNSRSELEQFVARAQGHGRVVAPPTEEGDTPTAVEGPTGDAGTVESTATPVEALPTTEAAAEPSAPAEGAPAATAPTEAPDQSVEDKLRAQLRAKGIEPEV